MSSIDPTELGKTVGAPSLQQTVFDPGTTKVQQRQVQETDTVTTSEKERDLRKQAEAAGVPVLPPLRLSPQDMEQLFIELTQVKEAKAKEKDPYQMALDLKMLEISVSVLDKWIETIHELQDQKQVVQALLETKKELQDQIKALQKEGDVKNESIDETGQSEQKGKGMQLMAQSIFLVAGIMTLGVQPGLPSLAAHPMQALTQMAEVIKGLVPTKLDTLFSSLLSLFGSSHVTQSTLLNLKNVGKSPQEYDQAFAKTYAKRTLSAIFNPRFEKAIETLFGKEVPKEVVAQKIQLAKLALLAQTLGFSYVQETGGMTGQEFLDIIDGTLKLPKEDYRQSLATVFRFYLNQLDPQNQLWLLEKLKNYFDASPELKRLSEPSRVFSGLFEKVSRGQLQG